MDEGQPQIPERVKIRAARSAPEGTAVMLCFHMRAKNHFHYMLFLDARGEAEVGREQLLKAFDQDRTDFLMDYVDPRVAFTGQITAQALGAEDLAKALDAYKMYQPYLEYPAGYSAQLELAAARAEGAESIPVQVDIACE